MNVEPELIIPLWDKIGQVNAIKEIESRRALGALTSDSVYDLYLLASGDPEVASQAKCNFVSATLLSGATPQ